MKLASLLNGAVLLLASAIGVVAFLSPFFTRSSAQANDGGALSHAGDAPFFLVVLIIVCLGAVLVNLSAGSMNARMVAILGVLTAFSAALRALPGPRVSMQSSSFRCWPVTCTAPRLAFCWARWRFWCRPCSAGVGPWLPFQMFTTGWVGMLGAVLPRFPNKPLLEVTLLAVWGMILGLLFGFIMNIWFWPFIMGPQQSTLYWQPGLSVGHFSALSGVLPGHVTHLGPVARRAMPYWSSSSAFRFYASCVASSCASISSTS
ncbi:MAG: hypothetical protein HZY76_06435 [Anaerolineae bacterium]|nr:MAG: hypothetical protein HZY76_06435 [Anaerolineae bacterium]